MQQNEPRPTRTPREQFAFWLTIGALMFAVSFAGLVGTIIFGGDQLRRFGIAMIILTAACLCGGLLGFLFGVSNASTGKTGDTQGTWNSHLVQIADWLTKIIVGLGLVEFRSILAALYDFGRAVNPHLTGNFDDPIRDQWGLPVSIALVISGSIGAFSLIYLWTTTRLPEVWNR